MCQQLCRVRCADRNRYSVFTVQQTVRTADPTWLCLIHGHARYNSADPKFAFFTNRCETIRETTISTHRSSFGDFLLGVTGQLFTPIREHGPHSSVRRRQFNLHTVRKRRGRFDSYSNSSRGWSGSGCTPYGIDFQESDRICKKGHFCKNHQHDSARSIIDDSRPVSTTRP